MSLLLSRSDLKSITWKEYISSPYWKRFSKKRLDDMDIECAICGKKKWSLYKKKTKKHKAGDKKRNVVLTLHHRNYKNLAVGEDDVIPICRGEHNLIHDIERMQNKHPVFKFIYNYICKHTAWGYEKAEEMLVPDDFVLKKTRVKS